MSLARWTDVWRRFSGSGAYPYELAFLLLVPLRRLVLSPAQLVARLELDRTSRVLEIGPGPGFFSVEVARAVPDGRLELVDLQREMLDKARQRLRRAGMRNAGCIQASAMDLPFQSDRFDVAFLVAVLGEVPDPKTALASIARVLRTGGRLAVVELPGDADVLTVSELREMAAGTSLVCVDAGRVGRASIVGFRKSGKTHSEDCA